ncbi:MAG: glycosyltransferase [Flavobacteriales bacterium]|nr:glycosyltransferase [Flavobacteriales bacterium]
MSGSEARPRLAVLTPRFPLPLNKGDRLRIYHQLAVLHERFEVDLHCLSFRAVDTSEIATLQQRCSTLTVHRLNIAKAAFRMTWSLFSRRPFQVLLFTERSLVRKIRLAIMEKSPDVLLAQMVRTAEYVKDLDAVPHILDIMDTLHAGAEREAERAPWWKRPILREEGRRLLRYEHRMPHYFDACTIISEQDRALLPHPDRSEVHIVPNGVDAAFFSPSIDIQPIETPPARFDVAFCGNLGYAPNIVAARFLCEDVAPCFEQMVGRPLKVLICGAQPAPAVKALSGRHVKVIGNVADIRSAYLAAPIFIAPMLVNTGLQNKLLEAMSLERACITTPRALAALGCDVGDAVATAEDAASFAQGIRLLLDDPVRCQTMGKAASNIVQERFTWQAASVTLVALLKKHAQAPQNT